MVTTKELLLGITLTMLCLPAFAVAAEDQADKKQQLEFLSFLAFIGSVTEMESAGIDVDQLLADPSEKTPKSPVLPFKETETDE